MEEIGLALGFWVLALLTTGAAVGVLLMRNILHAALFLVLSFVGVAGLYVMLRADFLAAVQILIYAGAISVLILFAIMLTPNTTRGNPWNRFRLPALILVGALLGAVLWVVVGVTQWQEQAISPLKAPTSVGQLAEVLFNQYLLPFEVASVMLLAAMIGAIVLTRE